MDADSMADSVDDDGVGEDVDAGIETDVEDLNTVIDTETEIDAPEPVTWTRPDSTGVPSVDAAIEELARLDQLPTSEHVAAYEGVHRQLQDALADLDGA